MFIAHIGAMDTFARGLRNVARMQEDGVLSTMLRDRYSTWGDGVGAKVPPCSSVASASGLTSKPQSYSHCGMRVCVYVRYVPARAHSESCTTLPWHRASQRGEVASKRSSR